MSCKQACSLGFRVLGFGFRGLGCVGKIPSKASLELTEGLLFRHYLGRSSEGGYSIGSHDVIQMAAPPT